ncbi:S-layer homology domain-containing protein [Peptococcus simiae]|uniref:S-layer homology domain-containing protein n=1 Tax=Peptococcus simiae TaxID=1643805 RepID=UPI00397EDD47
MKGKRKKNRSLCFFIIFSLLLSLYPIQALAAPGDVAINESNFPDPVFREQYVRAFDTDDDGILTQAECDAVDTLIIDGVMPGTGVKDLKGWEVFKNLKQIEIAAEVNNQVPTKNVNLGLFEKLEHLTLQENRLTSLDLSKNPNLLHLSYRQHDLKSLDFSKNPKLEHLEIVVGPLEELNLTQNPDLWYLNCSGNQLRDLDLSHNPNLWQLLCYDNQLTSLNLPDNISLDLFNGSNQNYPIKVNRATRTFDLEALPEGFDLARTANWQGGSVSGTTLTVDEGATRVSYDYTVQEGKSHKLEVTLNIHWLETIPYIPADSNNPTSRSDANIPTKDSANQDILLDDYNIIAFKVDESFKDKADLALAGTEGKLISVLVPKGDKGKDLPKPTPKPAGNVKFNGWKEALPADDLAISDGAVYTAQFIKNGERLTDPTASLPEGVYKLSLQKGEGIKADPAEDGKYGTYAIFAGTSIQEANAAATAAGEAAPIQVPSLTAADNYKAPKWYGAAGSDGIMDITGQAISADTVYTAKAEKALIADKVQTGEIIAKDFGVFVGTDVQAEKFWKQGCQVKAGLDPRKTAELQGYLDGAKQFEDLSGRATTAEVLDPTPGQIKITFSDDSSLTVDQQQLYVWKTKTENNSGNADKPKPEGSIQVRFIAGDGIESLAPAGKTMTVQSGLTLEDGDFPQATAKSGYKNPTWSPGDRRVTAANKDFTATAEVDSPAPTKPTVTDGKAENDPGKDSTTVTGKTSPNTEVTVTDDQGSKIGEGTSDGNGDFTIEIQPKKDEGSKITVTPKDGDPTTVTVEKGKPAPTKPTVTDGKAENDPGKDSTTVTGKTSPNTEVTVTDENDNEIGTGTSDGNGDFTIEIQPKKDEGTAITITPKDGKPVEITVEKKKPSPGSSGGGATITTPGSSSKPDDNKVSQKETHSHDIYFYGYEDKTVRPQGKITRAEAATMVARLKGLDMSDKSKPAFADVDSSWYNSAINAVVKAGLMSGYPDGSFKANGQITRAEFTQLIKGLDQANQASVPFSDIQGHWGLSAIEQAYANKRITGYPDGSFKPDNPISRAEAVTILNSLFDRQVSPAGLKDLRGDIVAFKDLDAGHWAYYEIIGASNSYEYYRAEDGTLVWTKLLKTWQDCLENKK